MGRSKARKERFFAEHPICCYCGEKPATTRDHQPNRAIFDDREGPEDFEFPSCLECNSGSRAEENQWSLIVRISPAPFPSESAERNFLKYASAAQSNFPQIFKFMSAQERDAYISEKAPELRDVIHQYEMAEIPESHAILSTVLQKLIRALYYKHTGRIASADCKVQVAWYANTDFPRLDKDQSFRQLVQRMTSIPRIKRGSKDLSYQFNYRYRLENENRLAAFVIGFRDSIVSVGYVEWPE